MISGGVYCFDPAKDAEDNNGHVLFLFSRVMILSSIARSNGLHSKKIGHPTATASLGDHNDLNGHHKCTYL